MDFHGKPPPFHQYYCGTCNAKRWMFQETMGLTTGRRVGQWPMANGRLCNLNTSGVTIKLGHATKITGVIDNIYI
jgi:hypothetical protein